MLTYSLLINTLNLFLIFSIKPFQWIADQAAVCKFIILPPTVNVTFLMIVCIIYRLNMFVKDRQYPYQGFL